MFTEDDILPVVVGWSGLVAVGASKERKKAGDVDGSRPGGACPAAMRELIRATHFG